MTDTRLRGPDFDGFTVNKNLSEYPVFAGNNYKTIHVEVKKKQSRRRAPPVDGEDVIEIVHEQSQPEEELKYIRISDLIRTHNPIQYLNIPIEMNILPTDLHEFYDTMFNPSFPCDLQLHVPKLTGDEFDRATFELSHKVSRVNLYINERVVAHLVSIMKPALCMDDNYLVAYSECSRNVYLNVDATMSRYYAYLAVMDYYRRNGLNNWISTNELRSFFRPINGEKSIVQKQSDVKQRDGGLRCHETAIATTTVGLLAATVISTVVFFAC